MVGFESQFCEWGRCNTVLHFLSLTITRVACVILVQVSTGYPTHFSFQNHLLVI
jgi:hypothetical protein